VWLELVLPPLIGNVIFNLVERSMAMHNSLTSSPLARRATTTAKNVRKVRINLRHCHFEIEAQELEFLPPLLVGNLAFQQ
jgi:hypothetical protein